MPSLNRTSRSVAPATTWLLVRIRPSAVRMTPEPSPPLWLELASTDTVDGSTLAATSCTEPAGAASGSRRPARWCSAGSASCRWRWTSWCSAARRRMPPPNPAMSASAAVVATIDGGAAALGAVAAAGGGGWSRCVVAVPGARGSRGAPNPVARLAGEGLRCRGAPAVRGRPAVLQPGLSTRRRSGRGSHQACSAFGLCGWTGPVSAGVLAPGLVGRLGGRDLRRAGVGGSCRGAVGRRWGRIGRGVRRSGRAGACAGRRAGRRRADRRGVGSCPGSWFSR